MITPKPHSWPSNIFEKTPASCLSTSCWGGHILRGSGRNQETWQLVLRMRQAGPQSLYQVGLLPVPRALLESRPESAAFTDDDMCLLLAAVVQDFVQRKISELDQAQETEDAK